MRYLPFVLKHLRANKVRSLSTVAALALCIFLFCTLQTFIRAVEWNLASASDTRLMTRHAVSLVFNLPVAYENRVAALPGVRSVAAVVWFGGLRHGDFKDFFPNWAVEAERYLAAYPEYELPVWQKAAFLADRRGCIVGRATAERYGFKLGDTLHLESFIPPYRIGKPFEFVVQGIYDADQVRHPGTDVTQMFFHFKYLDEATQGRAGVGSYLVTIADGREAASVGRAVDALFENSDEPTLTETESAFRAGFVAMAGNLSFVLNGIGLGVMFTILLVTANTMGMALRERRREIGVLKTLGFDGRLVMGLMLGEALLLGAFGGALGLLLGRAAIRSLPYLPMIGGAVRGFPEMDLSPAVAALGLGAALLLAFLAGLVPAWAAYRTRVVAALR